MKNNINPLALFGVFLLSIGGFALGIIIQIYQELQRRTFFEESDEATYILICFLITVIYIVLSIATMVRAKWARIPLIILLGILMIIFSLVVILNMHGFGDPAIVLASFCALIYGLLIFSIFFLSNRQILKFYEKEIYFNEDNSEILDSEF